MGFERKTNIQKDAGNSLCIKDITSLIDHIPHNIAILDRNWSLKFSIVTAWSIIKVSVKFDGIGRPLQDFITLISLLPKMLIFWN